MLKWAAIGDTPPFSEPVEFEFDEHVNVFIGPNATGKSTLLRKLAEGEYDPIEGQLPRFAFDMLPNIVCPTHIGPSANVLQESGETEWSKWESSWGAARSAFRKLPVAYVPASRLNIPLSTDTLDIGEMRSEATDHSDVADILNYSKSMRYFDGGVVYRATQKISENLQAGNYSNTSLNQLIRAKRLPFACATAICSDVLGEGEEQFDWLQQLAIGDADEGYEIVTTIHHDMAVHTAANKPDGPDKSVFVGDLSAGTQGTLLWIWYLALRIASFYDFSEKWESRPAILLIDEIENHLHPTWQRRVIPALLKFFPGLQIFATTHSPFVIAGLKVGQVHLLSRNDEGTVVASTNEQDIVGWTADEILRTFMGVQDPTDEETATNAQRLRELRRKDALEGLDEAEQTELEELRTKAGADILARGGLLNAQRERFSDMVQRILKDRLTDAPPNEDTP